MFSQRNLELGWTKKVKPDYQLLLIYKYFTGNLYSVDVLKVWLSDFKLIFFVHLTKQFDDIFQTLSQVIFTAQIFFLNLTMT